MPYLLDANVFIQAKNLHYGFDFCPAFWDWLSIANDSGLVCSITQVRDELISGDDELADWAHNDGVSFFKSVDEKTAPELRWVAGWINSAAEYDAAAKTTFQQVADFYLVAYARAHKLSLVTHEIPSDSRKKVKIPNACIAAGVEPVNTFQMLRREKVKFVLSGANGGKV